MHGSSYRHMQRLLDLYLDPMRPLSVLDVGAQDVNGTYRALFDHPDWSYRGCDRALGPNVDLVQDEDYRLPVATGSVDLAISGQTLEHVELFWLLFLELARVVRPGGLLFVIAPSRGPEHRYPVDCWRFLPDGFRALARYARLDLVEVHTDWEGEEADDSALWGDTVGVFRKPETAVEGVGRVTIDLAAGILETWSTGDPATGEPPTVRRVDLGTAEAGRQLSDLLARILWERRG